MISMISMINMHARCTTHPLRLPDRMNNGHMTISTINHTTHILWLLEQDEECMWNHQYDHTNMSGCTTYPLCWMKDGSYNHQHDHSHQYGRIYNSHPMIARAGWRMDINHQHNYHHQYGKMYNSQTMITRAGWIMDIWSQSPMWQNAQLTSYDFQSRIKNGQVISLINHQHAKMHNLHTMVQVARAGWITDMESSAWSQSACQNI